MTNKMSLHNYLLNKINKIIPQVNNKFKYISDKYGSYMIGTEKYKEYQGLITQYQQIKVVEQQKIKMYEDCINKKKSDEIFKEIDNTLKTQECINYLIYNENYIKMKFDVENKLEPFKTIYFGKNLKNDLCNFTFIVCSYYIGLKIIRYSCSIILFGVWCTLYCKSSGG